MPSKRKSLLLSSNKPTITEKLSNSRNSLNKINEDEVLNIDTRPSYGVSLFMYIIGLCITFFILDWLIKVHKCKCANIEEGLYLKEWYMFLIVWQIIGILYFIINGSMENSGIISFISTIIMIVSIVMIIRLLIYLDKLRKIKCDCGMSTRENIIYYWYIIGLSLLLLMILFTLIGYIFAYANK
jgi:hypothetical protein